MYMYRHPNDKMITAYSKDKSVAYALNDIPKSSAGSRCQEVFGSAYQFL